MFYERLTYLAVFLVLIACSFGLPLPEDVPLLTGGVLVQQGQAHLALMIPVGMVGVLTGDIVLFWIGRKFGHHVVEHRFLRRLIRPSRLVMAEALFARHGLKIVFIGRFLPGLRPMIFMAAGVLKVRFWQFALVNGAAACISVPTLILLGTLFGHNIERLQQDVRAVSHLLAMLALVAGLVIGAVYLHRRQKRMIESTGVETNIAAETLSHLPPIGDPPNCTKE